MGKEQPDNKHSQTDLFYGEFGDWRHKMFSLAFSAVPCATHLKTGQGFIFVSFCLLEGLQVHAMYLTVFSVQSAQYLEGAIASNDAWNVEYDC